MLTILVQSEVDSSAMEATQSVPLTSAEVSGFGEGL